MNYTALSSGEHPAIEEQAHTLAALTQNLALCCLGKESEIFAHYGLTSGEGHVLLMLADESHVTPSQLAQRLGVVRSRMTPIVQSLVDKGYLARTESSRDRRVRDLTLTDAGRAIAREAADFRLRFHARLLERFPEPERKRLLTVLTTLHERIHELRDELKSQVSSA